MLWKSPIELQCRAHLKELSKAYCITIGHPKVWSLNPYKFIGIVYKTSNYKSIQAFFAPIWTMIWSFYSLSGLKLGVKAHEYSYNLEFL
jgi:hypothetical protein